eukprot:38558-Pyramimonas_sp.AAC.1
MWGHETCEGCAGIGVGDACELSHWDLRQSSYVVTQRVVGCAKSVRGAHANSLSHWNLRRGSNVATKRVRGVPT